MKQSLNATKLRVKALLSFKSNGFPIHIEKLYKIYDQI